VVPLVVCKIIGDVLAVDRHFGAVEVAQRGLQGHAFHHLLLAECRQLDDVIQALDIGRRDALGAPQALVEGDLPGARHQLHEALVLQRAQLVAADLGQLFAEGLAQRVVRQDLADIEGLVIGRVAHGVDTQ
jgi:hypothetical protein